MSWVLKIPWDLVTRNLTRFRLIVRTAHDGLLRTPSVSTAGDPTRRLALSSLYTRFRDIEDLLAERGFDISYETVRRWVTKFGPQFARELRNRRSRPTSRWHLDEMMVTIAGRNFWLWRAVDDEGEVLDLLVQRLLQKTMFRPRNHGHGSASFLRSRQSRVGIVRPPRTGTAQEQPRRELASADETAREKNAAVQVAWISPTPALMYFQSATRSLRASATIADFFWRPPFCATRALNHVVSAEVG
jgi:DDE domain